MKARVVFVISVLTVFVFARIGLSGESSVLSNGGDKGSPEFYLSKNAAKKWPESGSNPNDLIAPQGSEAVNNTFYGESAGAAITSGKRNAFFGYTSGELNQDGYDNTFVGNRSGRGNVSGKRNAFFGSDSGILNTASYNTFIGYSSGYSNSTGEHNTFVGYCTGIDVTYQRDNTLVGYNAGHYIEGARNAIFGSLAGASSRSTGTLYHADSNTFMGAEAGKDITEGDYNTFVGDSSGKSNTEGSRNVFVGHWAGYSNKTGEKNTVLGYYAGLGNISGEGNVFLGYYAGAAETESNKLYINNSGHNTPLIWGDFNTNNVVIYGGFRAIASYSSSDGRWKKNIEPLASSLAKVSHLQGVSYEWKTETYPDFGLKEGKQIGLIAQDVEQVLPELVSEDKDGYKAVSYTKLTAVLVEAVKELETENLRQKKLIEKQQHQFQELQTEIETLRSMIQKSKS